MGHFVQKMYENHFSDQSKLFYRTFFLRASGFKKISSKLSPIRIIGLTITGLFESGCEILLLLKDVVLFFFPLKIEKNPTSQVIE